MTIDLSISQDENILRLLLNTLRKKVADFNLTLDDIIISNPREYETDLTDLKNTFNTSLNITNQDGKTTLSSPITLYYRRIPLSELVEHRLGVDKKISIVDLAHAKDTALTINVIEALQAYNECYTISIETRPSGRVAICQAVDQNKLYTGSAEVYFKEEEYV